MMRQIIHIDEDKCNGCGLCARACHEGAIDIVDGKAKLVREHFCDGFGDCLPNCPTGAITFEEREAPAYDEAAVERAKLEKKREGNDSMTEPKGTGSDAMAWQERQLRGNGTMTEHEIQGEETYAMSEKERQMQMEMEHAAAGHGCPGSRFMQLERPKEQEGQQTAAFAAKPVSRLNQWPCQIKLLPTQAPFYDGAKLLIAADCTAYAYANMHEDFMKGRIALIGCPKLDAVDYTDKLTEIIRDNDIKSVTIVRMEVPCCGGLQRAAENALRASGKFLPWQVVTISRDGRILE